MEKTFTKSNGETYAVVVTDLEKRIVTDKWEGTFETQENFRFVLDYIALQIETHQILGWLADLRHMVGSFDASSDWLGKELMPRAIKAGLKKEAIVVPQNVFARLSTKDTIQKIHDFELRQFDNLMEAEEWLLEMVQPLVYENKK